MSDRKKNQTRRRANRRAFLAPGALALAIVLAASFLALRTHAGTPNDASSQPAVKSSPLVFTPVRRVLIVSEGLEDGRLSIVTNKTAVLNTRLPYKRLSIGAPDIADVNPIGPMNVLVTAKKVGTTQLVLWDDSDRSQVIDVAVAVDLGSLRDLFRQNFPGSKIEPSVANGQIVLRGRVPSTVVAEQAVQLAQPFAPKVLNFLEVAGGQQVMLQVRFAEVSRSATNALGVNFGFTDGGAFFGSNIGQVSPLGIKEFLNDTTGLATPGPASSVTLFGRGLLGQVAFDYYIQALRQNNLLRVLAEPTVTTMSGQEASFLAGGEFPIPVTQGGGTGAGGTAVTVEYRTFGVKLNFVPLVLGDGRIRLKVTPEVSDLDFTTAVRFNGFVIPGLSQRKLTTVVEMAEGQTLALAGLLNNNVSATKDVTPVLGDLPIVGALFRSVRYQRKETELVIIVTPRLAEAVNPAQVPPLPGEKWRHPTEGELFWDRDLGGTGGNKKRAAKMTEKAAPKAQAKTEIRADDKVAPAAPEGEAPRAEEGPSTSTPASPAPAETAAPKFKGQFGYVPVSESEQE
jgi:pilus assembly protein CpaC